MERCVVAEADLENVRAILDDVRAALAADDLAAFGEADRRFHALIVELSDNSTLSQTLSGLDAQVRLVRRLANRGPDLVVRATAERQQLLDALAARDSDRAAELMEAHIDGVRRAVAASFESLGSSNARLSAYTVESADALAESGH